MRKFVFTIPVLLILTILPVQAVFATGSPTLAPDPVPSACSSNCNPILISGPTFGFAITFSQNNSVTGHWKKLSGPVPFNVTLTDFGDCTNKAHQTAIPQNTDGAISPLFSHGYLYCLYYTTLPAAKTYSLEIVFKHPGDVQFDQTITWAIP